MECVYCGKDFSDKVCRVHQEICPEKNKVEKEFDIEKATKAELVIFILEHKEADKAELNKLKKDGLLDIAIELLPEEKETED